MVGGLPQQRARTSETPSITLDDDAPDDVREAVESLVTAAADDPYSLRHALRNGTVLSSPSRVVAEAELGDPDEKRNHALGILARVFETRADRWVDYDEATQAEIQAGIQDIDTDTARSWRLDTYLGRASLALDAQTPAALPPPNVTGHFDAAA